MKLLFLLIAITSLSFSLTARSENLLGGQSGNGGNGCWIRSNSGLEWKSIEELIYPEHFQSTRPMSRAFMLPAASRYEAKSIDLSQKIQVKKAFKRLNRLSILVPRTFELLLEMSKLFEHAYIIQTNISGVFEGDISRLYPKCHYFSPAVVSLDDGSILFFKPTWDKLSSLSSEVILVHETIRLAQLLHPAFKDLSNSELQELTALLFSTRRLNYRINNILGSIEQSLRKNYQMHETCPSSDTVEMIRSQVNKAIQNKDALGESLNELRKNHPAFKRAVQLNIKELLLNHR
jgi:hypothetical protein